MDEQTPLLLINNVTLFQQDAMILENVDLKMDKGEFVYLIGKTGSGKSTLLKSLYADLKISAGSITYRNKKIERLSKKEIPFLRREIGIIFQDFQLLFDRTIYDNLEFVLKATGWSDSSKIKNRIAEVLMRVGLGSSNNKMPHQLSGGEQQRTVIARALLNEPFLLIADEPTGNLDPEVADEIHQLFKTINHSGTAILMATHNHQLIAKYPRRTIQCIDKKLVDLPLESLK